MPRSAAELKPSTEAVADTDPNKQRIRQLCSAINDMEKKPKSKQGMKALLLYVTKQFFILGG